LQINWKRVILDEAHIVRNYKSKAAEAVCKVVASKRWAVTGTPIQNSERDLYSILKFLKCVPFDDLRVWKRWIDKKDPDDSHKILATLMKTLMLRRTKEELIAKGELKNFPEKVFEEVTVRLDHEERWVYEKILFYCRTLFAHFLTKRAKREHTRTLDLYIGKSDTPAFASNPSKILFYYSFEIMCCIFVFLIVEVYLF